MNLTEVLGSDLESHLQDVTRKITPDSNHKDLLQPRTVGQLHDFTYRSGNPPGATTDGNALVPDGQAQENQNNTGYYPPFFEITFTIPTEDLAGAELHLKGSFAAPQLLRYHEYRRDWNGSITTWEKVRRDLPADFDTFEFGNLDIDLDREGGYANISTPPRIFNFTEVIDLDEVSSAGTQTWSTEINGSDVIVSAAHDGNAAADHATVDPNSRASGLDEEVYSDDESGLS